MPCSARMGRGWRAGCRRWRGWPSFSPPSPPPCASSRSAPARGPACRLRPAKAACCPSREQITDFGPRTEALGAAQRVFGQPPVPTRYDLDKYKRFILGLDDPTFTFEVIVGHTRLLHLKEAPIRIQIGDTRVFDYTILGPPTELLLQGASVGSTTMFIWFGDRAEPANQTIMAFQINVLPDPDVKRRLEEVYKALQDEINKAFPDAYVCLTLVGDKLVVSGEVKDAIEANRVIQILTRGNASATAQNPVLSNPAGGTNFNLNLGGSLAPIGNFPFIPGIPEGQIRPDLSNYILPGESNIINLLRIPGEQQVMLKCTLASVNRTAAREIGLGFTIGNKAGTPVFSDTNGVTPNLPLVIDKGRSSLLINALRTNNMARNLAEPNVVALNGRPATIFSGGEFAVPVVTGATAVGLQGVSYIPFGVTLTFTPVITDRDRIRLTVNASVSALGPARGQHRLAEHQRHDGHHRGGDARGADVLPRRAAAAKPRRRHQPHPAVRRPADCGQPLPLQQHRRQRKRTGAAGDAAAGPPAGAQRAAGPAWVGLLRAGRPGVLPAGPAGKLPPVRLPQPGHERHQPHGRLPPLRSAVLRRAARSQRRPVKPAVCGLGLAE